MSVMKAHKIGDIIEVNESRWVIVGISYNNGVPVYSKVREGSLAHLVHGGQVSVV